MARRLLASLLEHGALAGLWPGPLERALGAVLARGIARPLVLPDGIAVVTVGGATLGGSGKTRVAAAAARALAASGADVVVVSHAYRARPGRPREVPPDGDPRVLLSLVGDEALATASALAGIARVVVGASRQEAVDLAARRAPDVIVLDGPLQLAPVRASLSLLAVDREAPWGAGALPPAGDLRAPRGALLAAADHVVPVDAAPQAALLGERRLPIDELAAALRDRRLGLFTALARPERLVAGLARAGLVPVRTVSIGDHGPLAASTIEHLRAAAVDVWLATPKCAVHLDGAGLARALQIAKLADDLTLPPAVLEALAGVRAIPTTARNVGRCPTRENPDGASEKAILSNRR
ncbi:MAG: Tetraacyldisaccharide 4-kinase [Labilithrix sp.]|nr:Tetraacyldisaccharide 4-kinase [Labilithrix sp.]